VNRQRLLSTCHGSLLLVTQEMHAILARSSHLSRSTQEAPRIPVGQAAVSPNMYAATPGRFPNHSVVSFATSSTAQSSHYDAGSQMNPRISWDCSTVTSVNGYDDVQSKQDCATDLGEELETENGCIFMFSPTNRACIERPNNDPVPSEHRPIYEMTNAVVPAQKPPRAKMSRRSSPLVLSPMQSISSQLSFFRSISPLTTPPTPPPRPPPPQRSARKLSSETNPVSGRRPPRYRNWSDPPKSLIPGVDKVRQAQVVSYSNVLTLLKGTIPAIADASAGRCR